MEQGNFSREELPKIVDELFEWSDAIVHQTLFDELTRIRETNMIEQCPNPQEDCVWYDRPTPKPLQGLQEHGCFSDVDHVVPKRFRTQGFLVRHYIDTPDNKEQICRREHDDKPLESFDDIPTPARMLDAISRAMASGALYLSLRDRERLEQIRTELGECYE